MSEADVPAILEIFQSEPNGAIGIVKFLRASAGGPLSLKGWQRAAKLIAVDAVTALVRTTIGGVFHAASRNGFAHDGSQFTYAIVFIRPSDIEDLIVDGGLRRFQHGGDCSGDVSNVHNGTPRRAVALYVYSACRVGRCH